MDADLPRCARNSGRLASGLRADRTIIIKIYSVTSMRKSILFLFRLVAVLHDIAGLEEYALQDFAPFLVPPHQELQIHPKMLELLVLRVSHDGLGLTVCFQRQSLLVPTDCFRLFDERRDHARERARLCRELAWRLVI